MIENKELVKEKLEKIKSDLNDISTLSNDEAFKSLIKVYLLQNVDRVIGNMDDELFNQ